ncbi:unnamed protein product [Allacma fusca]|uniref:Uncharacterized protein n=1 Tax=Allacma fusca TaxID=39272 RepID=A0A8J2NYF5_9HEXA|nr:unnamed protein product [Allacma fusca]
MILGTSAGGASVHQQMLSPLSKGLPGFCLCRKSTDYLFNPHIYGEGFEPIVEAVKDGKTYLGEQPLKIVSDGRGHRVPTRSAILLRKDYILHSNAGFEKS